MHTFISSSGHCFGRSFPVVRLIRLGVRSLRGKVRRMFWLLCSYSSGLCTSFWNVLECKEPTRVSGEVLRRVWLPGPHRVYILRTEDENTLVK